MSVEQRNASGHQISVPESEAKGAGTAGEALALGNVVWGIPLNAHKDFTGSFLDLFNFYSILVGITTVALFMMHGSIYVVLKTEGKLHDQARGWINNCIIFFFQEKKIIHFLEKNLYMISQKKLLIDF